MPRDDEDLHVARLLAGKPDEPSVWEKEAAFDALARLSTPARRKRPWAWGGALLAAAAAALLVVWPHESAEFVARGGPATAPSVALSCALAGKPSACTQSATLHFEIHGASPGTYVAAFAQASDGTIIWYFPGPAEQTAPLGLLNASVLDRAVRLASHHQPGTYRVFVVFAERPLDRATLKRRLGPELEGDASLEVVSVPLAVLP